MAGRLPQDYAQDGLELDIELANGANDEDEARIPLIPLLATTTSKTKNEGKQQGKEKDKSRNGHLDENGDDDNEEDAEWAELTALEEELSKEHGRETGQNYPPRPHTRTESQHKVRDNIEDDPALEMVRKVVKETDDPSLPNITFRVLLLGTILCAVGAAISQLFFVRVFTITYDVRKSKYDRKWPKRTRLYMSCGLAV